MSDMEPKKKMGRPSQGKVRLSLTFDKDAGEYIASLPDGERSRFVNEAAAEKIEKEKAQQKFFATLEGKEERDYSLFFFISLPSE